MSGDNNSQRASRVLINVNNDSNGQNVRFSTARSIVSNRGLLDKQGQNIEMIPYETQDD